MIIAVTGIIIQSCNKEDDGIIVVPPRDFAEVVLEDEAAIEEYLQTHFYYLNTTNPPSGFVDFIEFDTIAGANIGQTPLMDQVYNKELLVQDIPHKVYILKLDQGLGDAPKFTDSVVCVYKGNLLDGTLFDSGISPSRFDLTSVTRGFNQGVIEFNGSTGTIDNGDGTTSFTDFGRGAIFMPSGLAYFNESRPNIPAYSPLTFRLNLLQVNEADHDNDNVPSYLEDLDGDELIVDDDSDGDNFPDYLDTDDDGDGTPTREEDLEPDSDLTVDRDGDGDPTNDYGDGDPTNDDSDNDGIPNYLDPDSTASSQEDQ